MGFIGILKRYNSKLLLIQGLHQFSGRHPMFPDLVPPINHHLFYSDCSQLWSRAGIAPKKEGQTRAVIEQRKETVTHPVFSYIKFANLQSTGCRLSERIWMKRKPPYLDVCHIFAQVWESYYLGIEYQERKIHYHTRVKENKGLFLFF